MLDNLEKLKLVKRVASPSDRRQNLIVLTDAARKMQDHTMEVASNTLNEALEGVVVSDVDLAKVVLQKVYDNLK